MPNYTCPSYRRYRVLDTKVVGSKHIERTDEQDTSMGVRQAGQRTKLLPLVGYVSKYGRFYRWRLYSQSGDGTADSFWDGTYNIRNGRNGGLESTLRRMSQANFNLRVF